MKGKAGTIASRPILQRDKDSMIQPTYYGSQRLGTYCILRALTPRKNQVLLPSHEQNLNPHKPIIHYSTRIHGRRKNFPKARTNEDLLPEPVLTPTLPTVA